MPATAISCRARFVQSDRSDFEEAFELRYRSFFCDTTSGSTEGHPSAEHSSRLTPCRPLMLLGGVHIPLDDPSPVSNQLFPPHTARANAGLPARSRQD